MSNPQRNGVAPAGPTVPKVLWNYTDGAKHWGQPVVYKDRIVYGERNGYVRCLDEFTGEVLWEFAARGAIYSTPAVWESEDGKIYVFIGDYGNYFHALDFYTGEEIWSFETTGAIMSPPLVYNGKVYFGSKDQFVYALDAKTGEEIWRFETGGQVRGPGTLGDNLIYFASYDGKVYALKPDSGEKVWEFAVGGAPFGVTYDNGVVYVVGDISTGGSVVYALKADTGEVIWQTTIGKSLYNHPLVIPEGYVIVKEYKPNAKIIALDKNTGDVVWTFEGKGPFYQHVVYADGKLYFGTDLAILYCINASTGKQIWNLTVFGADVQDLSLADGILFVGSNDYKMYAIGTLPPALITISKPVEKGWTTSTFTVEWTVVGVGLDHIEIYLDNKLVASDISPTVAYYTLSDVSSGEHTITIRAVDKQGGISETSRTFKVDANVPQVSFKSPKPGETVASTTIRIEWTASDNESGIDKFEVYLDGKLVDETTNTFTVVTDVKEGPHTVIIKAFDKAGNVAEIEADFKVEIPFFTKYGQYIIALIIAAIILGALYYIAKGGKKKS